MPNTHLLKKVLGVHKAQEGIVGSISHDTPRIPPGETLFCVENGALLARKVVVKVAAATSNQISFLGIFPTCKFVEQRQVRLAYHVFLHL